VVGGGFGLGLFGLPKLGMPGVAAGQLTAFHARRHLPWHGILASGRSRPAAEFRRLQNSSANMFVDILKVRRGLLPVARCKPC